MGDKRKVEGNQRESLVTANLQDRIEMKSMYLCVLEESFFSVEGTNN